jgi:hypothetical protein
MVLLLAYVSSGGTAGFVDSAKNPLSRVKMPRAIQHQRDEKLGRDIKDVTIRRVTKSTTRYISKGLETAQDIDLIRTINITCLIL